MKEVLKSYLKKLTNLSSSNKSLLQMRLYASQDIDVEDFDFLENQTSFNIIEQIIAGKSRIPLCQNLDSRNENVNEATKRLKRIFRTENFVFEERGVRDLYLGWPFVQGRFIDGTPVRCPLVFFPVSLEATQEKWYLRVRKDVNITFNKSFLLAYAYFNEVTLHDDVLERIFDNFDGDSQEFRNELYQFLKDSPLEINFNQEVFADKLKKFRQYKRDEYESNFGVGEIKLFPEAVIGLYPQAGSYLVPDYDQMIGSDEFENLEEFFLQRSTPDEGEEKNIYRFLRQVREDQSFTPFPIDASQENALKAVKSGNSIVVQGPPGTGKSQLICNLVSDYIARGLNVLVVCQKRAALDVVNARLREKDLGSFTALVHDFKNDRKGIYEKINEQIEKLEEYQHSNNALDTIYLERNFLQTARRIDQITEELDQFKSALFDDSESGFSVKELYLNSDPEADAVDLRNEYRHFNAENIREFEEKFANFHSYAKDFLWADHNWKDRKSFKKLGVADLKKMNSILDSIPKEQNEFRDKINEILKDPFGIEEVSWVLDREELIEEFLTLLEDPKVFEYFHHLINYQIDKDWYLIKERAVFECFKDAGVEVSIPTDQIGEYLESINKRLSVGGNIFKRIKYAFFSKDKYKLKRAMVANDLQWGGSGFKQLEKKIDNRLNLEHNVTELLQCEWLLDFPQEFDQQSIRSWFDDQNMAIEAVERSEKLRSFRDYLKIETVSFPALKSKLHLVISECKKADELKKEWLEYLTPTQIDRILQDLELAGRLNSKLKEDFDSLCEFDKIRETMMEVELQVIEKIHDNLTDLSLTSMLDLFKNSIFLMWIDHLETKHPQLRTVTTQKFAQLERELQKAIQSKGSDSKDILLLKIRERTYRNVEYNRLKNMVSYRDLKHQVTKKRKIWPLRKTIAEHREELFDLIPCWMASPESVSAIFPMEQIFDLVIFDEASQCYTEKGIPAMYRGKQVVIAGDDQQLSPNDLYQIRWEEEEEELPELEIDSLLDLSKKYLMEVHLRGHYRSKSLDLIDYSNQNFYKNRLRLLPDFKDMSDAEPGIKYIKVDGLWKSSCNTPEAEKVVDLVLELIGKGQTDIGIVTFNYKQQNHIIDLLESRCVDESINLPENLFVKNIENVQGDERDIIIFSIGYAPDSRGRFHMQFGSLNMEKGENRLNVAVTRSRERIYVVASILPQQLKVDDTKHDGPKMLRKYLQYAFDVSEGTYVPEIPKNEQYNTSWFLKYKLQSLVTDEKEYELRESLPFADMTFSANNEYKALVLTDDNLYFEALSVKDAHAYVPMTLKGKKWKFTRVFSRNYWSKKDKVREQLLKLIS